MDAAGRACGKAQVGVDLVGAQRLVDRRARQDVDAVQPRRRAVGDDRRLGDDEPKGRRAEVDGVDDLRRDVRAAQHGADQGAVEQEAEEPARHARVRAACWAVNGPSSGSGHRSSSRVRSGGSQFGSASHAADGAPANAGAAARHPQAPYGARSAPECPVRDLGVPPSARSAP